MANNYNNQVKGSSMRQKLQNSKGYAESPEFLANTGAILVCRYKLILYHWFARLLLHI